MKKYTEMDQDELNLEFQLACMGDLEVVKYLLTSSELENHAEIDCGGDYGNHTGLINAIVTKKKDIIEYLCTSSTLTKQAVIMENTEEMYSPFVFACGYAPIDIVKLLYDIAQVKREKKFSDETKPFIYAFNYMIKHKDDRNLLFLFEKCHPEDLIKIKKNINIDLIHIASKQSIEYIDYLIQGTNFNMSFEVNESHYQSLLRAIEYNKIEMVHYLLNFTLLKEYASSQTNIFQYAIKANEQLKDYFFKEKFSSISLEKEMDNYLENERTIKHCAFTLACEEGNIEGIEYLNNLIQFQDYDKKELIIQKGLECILQAKSQNRIKRTEVVENWEKIFCFFVIEKKIILNESIKQLLELPKNYSIKKLLEQKTLMNNLELSLIINDDSPKNKL